MAVSVVTKQLFADEFQRLAQDKPISKINVTEICHICGTTRQAFYYHFRDKYDLIAWIYLQDLKQALVLENQDGGNALQHFLEIVDMKRDFYYNALQDTSQNNLMAYTRNYQTEFILSTFKQQHHIEASHELRIEQDFILHAPKQTS